MPCRDTALRRGAQGILHEERLGDRSSRGRELCNPMEKRKGRGASSARRLMRQGGEAARACAGASVHVALHRIFGISGPSRPRCSSNCRGRTWVCHAHVHHHWPSQEVDEEVDEEVATLGVAQGARRDPCLVRVCGGSSIGGCRGRGCGGCCCGGPCGGHRCTG